MQHVVVATLVRSSRFLCLIATLGVLVPRSVVFFVETGRLCVQNYPSQRSRNPTLALVNIDRSHRVNDDERTVLSLRSRHYASNRTGRRPLPWRMATDGCVTSTIAPNPVISAEQRKREIFKLLRKRVRTPTLLVYRKRRTLVERFTCLLSCHKMNVMSFKQTEQ